MKTLNTIRALAVFFFMLILSSSWAYEITRIEPTVFFPKVDEGKPLKQVVKVTIHNSEGAANFQVRTSTPGQPPSLEDLGLLETGQAVRKIQVPDIPAPTEMTFDLLRNGDPTPLATTVRTWQPQKKWKVFHVAHSQHDLGYADYYHLMTRDVREWGIERALRYCTLTDDSSWTNRTSRFLP